MKRFIGVALLAAVAAFGTTAPASACEGKDGKDGKGGKACCGMMEKLGLTAEQNGQVEKLHLGMKQKMVAFKAQLGVKKAEMKLLWTAENPERKAILAKMAEIAAIEQKMQEAHVDVRLAVAKILNPEQRVGFLAHDCDHGRGGNCCGERHGGGDCCGGERHGKKECSHGGDGPQHREMAGPGGKSCGMHKEGAPKAN